MKSLLLKDNYVHYRSFLRKEDFSKELRPVLAGIDQWYKGNTDSPALEDIANLTFASGIPEKDLEYTKGIFSTLQSINGSESIKPLLERFKQVRLCEDMAATAFEASRGSRSVLEVLSLADQLRAPAEAVQIEYVTDDLKEILHKTFQTQGLRWRLNCLNKSLGSLRQGDFGFVFARPETGKTTFLASEVTHMASQLGEESGPILWFNNEEQGEKVKLRCFQGALGAKLEHLDRAPDRAQVGYMERTKGKIKIYDNASLHYRDVEAICQQEKPSLILFDQIDKIQGFVNDRDDLVMGAIYQWAREIAKKYCPVIGICQADGTAEGVRYLNMGHVALAKTAKQAEADFILGIGKTNDSGLEFIRYLTISKNKLTGDSDSDPRMRHARMEVVIEPEIARYTDIGY